ncbi:RagB/SusD family nutrient uptake outer membrane protein [Jiulongibacter sediminis]|uniref:Glycan metabolism protein n=1 Tax=Jiulongibacter sediminis TaxID=1605367 RepID=A0A0P7C3T2_9BACT|nr:RagB/SusD family nutrient uptake outer membrane protein [Jiulongibacter sediminis]KPM48981.1 glycan metabolism protein [Jiulongibacter sediminis]TBX25508.1 glycan metabolism protein [Jiulongibacter sediminis]
MKTINFKKVLIGGLSVMFMASCTDLVNDEKDSIVRANEGGGGFTPGNPTELLVSAYKDLSAYTDQANIYALGQHPTAEMIPPTRGVDWGDNGVWRTLDQHTWDATHSGIINAWNQLNQRVYKCNEIIASNPSAAEKAEAQFLRALNMFHVMDYWGQVPFREVTDGVDVNPKVLTRSEAFDFIVSDLEAALPGLENRGPAPLQATASKAAANFLLAKLYLNKAVYTAASPAGPYSFDNGDMAKVISYVDAIIADGYEISDDFFGNFTADATTETILNSAEGTPQNRWMMTLHYDQNPSGWNGFTTLADFYDTFSDEDIRKGIPAAADGSNMSGIGHGFLIGQQYKDDGTPITDSRSQQLLKFTRDVSLAGTPTDKGIRVIKYHPAMAGKYILMRFAEAYLMKAEAMMRSGDTAGALAMINDLRAKRQASALSSLDENSLFDEIGREMYWEGGKRTTEVRFGKFTTGTGALIQDDYTVLYPIPSPAIVSNPNLTQNEGY